MLFRSNKNVLIDFDIEGITINGYTSSETDYDLYNEEVLDGCQYVFTIKVDNDFMEQNEITEITEVQFSCLDIIYAIGLAFWTMLEAIGEAVLNLYHTFYGLTQIHMFTALLVKTIG